MLDRYVNQGRVDALRRFGCEKLAMALGPAGVPAAAPPINLGPAGAAATAPHLDLGPAGAAGHAPPAAAAPGGGFADRARAFGGGQLGAAKDLFGNLRQGLGGAATAEAGVAARGAAVGNLKTLAPTLAAGGALYLMHRHNQAKQEQQARQQAMAGGYQ